MDENTILKGLSDLKIQYILVNQDNSSDYYHDFKNAGLWNSIGKVVWRGSDDIIYSYYVK